MLNEMDGSCPEFGARAPDGFPLPPPQLRLLGDGRNQDVAGFLESGEQVADSIRSAAAKSGASVDEMDAILDFGCGCGRVARHWAGLERTAVHGVDFRPGRVAWCGESLPFLRTVQVEPAPPLPYESGSFDLIYSLSAFSHMPAKVQKAWIGELRRVLRPGGLLVLSLLGDGFRYRLGAESRRAYDRDELVVERQLLGGTAGRTAYHPPAYVYSQLLAGFEEARGFHLGPLEWLVMQDAYIARRPIDS